MAFEKIVLSRQLLGEENDSLFGQNLMTRLIEIWNDNIKQLREEFASSLGSKVLKELEENPQQEAAEKAKAAMTELLDDLKVVVIPKTPGALRILGWLLFVAFFHNIFFLYISIYANGKNQQIEYSGDPM